jgi:hypothetical protein
LIAAANVSENRFGSSGSATILLTTQYLEEADQLADEIAVIDHGRVIAEGTGNELKDRVGGQILEVERRRLRVRPRWIFAFVSLVVRGAETALAWIVGIVAPFVPPSVWRYRRMS